MPKITVDGQLIECRDRIPILQACTEAGIAIPHYCYHEGLSAPASCRICLVEVEGVPKLVPSCNTPVRDGMVVHSTSTKAIANQKQVMEYLLVNHPLDCPVCDQAGECLLQDYSYQYGRSQSRFEEDKAKKPKKDVGENILLYNDRCIMCTRCVRFTREISGTSELYVDGRGHREQIDIFPGQPLNNKLAGNVVDICPVGALLDKDFLFKQRVWMLKQTPSISPMDAGGENIWIHHNEGVIYRIKPRYNAQANKWWISDDTRYAHKHIAPNLRLAGATRTQYGAKVPTDFDKAIEEAATGLKQVAAAGEGSVCGVFSPMMSCEEAFLLGTWLRSIDPQAVLTLGPVPNTAEDEVFKHSITGVETFRISSQKVPNAAGIRRVIEQLGGPTATWDELLAGKDPKVAAVKGAWIVGGYLSNWITKDQPPVFKKGFRVVQDILPNALTGSADILLPAAGWAEKDGCWESKSGLVQAFAAAVAPPSGTRREADVYHTLLGREGYCRIADVRQEMGGVFADVSLPSETTESPAFEFTEL